MTWWAEEERKPELVAPGNKARQRWEQLRRDVREVVPASPAVGERFRARFPMSGWQEWRRVDSTWCEFVSDGIG